jgi:hypothetical protein
MRCENGPGFRPIYTLSQQQRVHWTAAVPPAMPDACVLSVGGVAMQRRGDAGDTTTVARDDDTLIMTSLCSALDVRLPPLCALSIRPTTLTTPVLISENPTWRQVEEPADARGILTACALCECVYKPVAEAYVMLPAYLQQFCVGLQYIPHLCFTAHDVHHRCAPSSKNTPYHLLRTSGAPLFGFGWEIAHVAVSRRPPISLDTIVARTKGYTHAAKVWD